MTRQKGGSHTTFIVSQGSYDQNDPLCPIDCQAYSCVMVRHKSDYLMLSTEDLLVRRRELAACLGDLEKVLLGSLVEQTRKCGKLDCRCATGEPHGPYSYLTPRRGRRGMRYVPSGMASDVAAYLSRGEQIEAALAEISAINVELLARRELG
jgi:hypothetical protein